MAFLCYQGQVTLHATTKRFADHSSAVMQASMHANMHCYEGASSDPMQQQIYKLILYSPLLYTLSLAHNVQSTQILISTALNSNRSAMRLEWQACEAACWCFTDSYSRNFFGDTGTHRQVQSKRSGR